MSNDWSFKVSSELKNILGRDLITNSNIAVLELVKNSYDAHASEVKISFLDDTLVISDNGKGMSEEDVINKWLFVAYSAKSDGTEDKNYRNTIKRKYAGAKGIGRLSCDRLGRFLTLTTKSNSDNHAIELYIDWNDFELNSKDEFNHIPVKHSVISSSPYFPEGTTGTVLKFTGLHDKWDATAILRLKKSLEKLINPFSGADEFKIIFDVPSEIDHDKEKIEECAQLKAMWDKLTPYKQRETIDKERSIINGPLINSIAETLNLKTTRIDSTIKGNRIFTKLSDRGITIYEIEEYDKYPLLEDVSISLFYLNQQAKYNFSILMGTPQVNYGSVFLFRNGFRIMPYGEFRDDSWGLDQRVQQGYNRVLGTRQILGRVDVETEDKEAFKEVSSRDGGLIKTPSYQQLLEYFNSIHRRLERYVVGVLWGEAFLRKDYFQKKEIALDIRNKLQGAEKDSDNMEHVLTNIGSKIDFLQLVKSLVNDESINLLSYNEDLANIVSDVDDTEIIQGHMIDDFRKIANKTNDAKLLQNLSDFEKQIDELRRQKVEAEKRVKEERERAIVAAKKAAEERKKRQAEEEKRKKAEEELEQKTKQNLFLQSVGSLDLDRILKFHHDIRIHSSTISNTISRILKLLHKGILKLENLESQIERIGRANDKVMSIAQFATKANFSVAADSIEADLVEYIYQYVNDVLPEFYDDCKLNCQPNGCSKIMSFKPLEVSLIIDNLLSNAIKANATSFDLLFHDADAKIVMTISDNGRGIDKSIPNPESVFEKGFTTTNGSGLGLYNIETYVRNQLGGSINLDKDLIKTTGKFVLIISIPK